MVLFLKLLFQIIVVIVLHEDHVPNSCISSNLGMVSKLVVLMAFGLI